MTEGSNMDSLMHSVKIGSLQGVQCILNKGDMRFDEEYLDYSILKTSLLNNHIEIAKLLVKHNFRVNKSSLFERDQTPLHLAVKRGRKDIVELLLQKKASVTVQCSTNLLTPIQLSFLEKFYEITDMMLPHDEGKAIFDSETNISHLHIAAARNCVTAINKYLRFRANINLCLPDDHPDWSRCTPLHIAVQFQNRESVELLLKWGADITAQDKIENTPLHLAVKLQNDSLIDLILSEHKYSCDNPKNKDGLSHFHIACTRNDAENVYGFLRCGVDTNAKVSESAHIYSGFTALDVAVTNQCTDVIEILLMNSIFGGTNTKDFLLHVHKTENPKIISLFSFVTPASAGTCNTNISLLHIACIQKKESDIKRLIDLGVSVNDRLPEDAPRLPGATALHILLQVSSTSYCENREIKILVENGADIAAVDARGKTPLHIAFEKDDRSAVKLVLAQYSKMNVHLIADKDGLSHFHIACAESGTDLVIKFLDAGADINSVVSNDSLRFPGYTPLHVSIAYKNSTTATELLNRGADITIKDGLGLTAFDLLLQTWDMNGQHSYKSSYECIESFLKAANRMNMDAFDTHGFTLLHTSCVTENEDLFKNCVNCLKVNAAVDFKSKLYPAGYTALHFAVQYGTNEMVKTLLDYGADPSIRTPTGCTPLHLRCYSFPKIINGVYLMNHVNTLDARLILDENPFNSNGFSHFHVACELNELDIVRTFLDRGVDVNLKTKNSKEEVSIQNPLGAGVTGLHMAVRKNYEELTDLLLESGADVNARDSFLKTPLDYELHGDECSCFGSIIKLSQYRCGKSASIVVLDALLEHGADIRIPTKSSAALSGYFDECCMPRRDLIRKLFTHTVAMIIADSQISYLDRMQTWYLQMQGCYANCWKLVSDSVYAHERMPSRREYQAECSTELYFMKPYLRDVLRQDIDSLVADNKFFDSVRTAGVGSFTKKYPIYGYLIEAQYRRGMKRKVELRKKSIWALV